MLQRPEVPLHDADRQAVVQREVFGTLREHGSVSTWDDVSEFTRSATTLRTGFRSVHAGKHRCTAHMIKDVIVRKRDNVFYRV